MTQKQKQNQRERRAATDDSTDNNERLRMAGKTTK